MNLLDSSEMAYKNGYNKAIEDLSSILLDEIDKIEQEKSHIDSEVWVKMCDIDIEKIKYIIEIFREARV